ncbi:MAG: mechanosensitive ion channel, partial [Thermoplasmata archaeon]|nr:mechanosensitive ion channel [Thermoplasmata archaeon]
IVPNNKIANEKVINLTQPDQRMKVKISIGVDYKTNIIRAKEIMLEVANSNPGVITDDEHKPFVRLVDFQDSAVLLKLFTWVHHLDDQWRVASELREEIFNRFKAEGIEIPFPQTVVHMENNKKDTEKMSVRKAGLTPTKVDE